MSSIIDTLSDVNNYNNKDTEMDPFTLFALANGAVSAVKAGCQLYKDIKGAAGEVSGILQDLDNQFNKRYPPERPATVEQRNQYVKERNRVVELNKRNGEVHNIYQDIGNHLGTYYDNFYKCMAVFEEEERRGRNEVYTGESSLGKRALQRVLMKKQLEHMAAELREIMVYQSPPELGALWTEVNDMMQVMGKEQKVAMTEHLRRQQREQMLRKRRRDKLTREAALGIGILIVVFTTMFIFMLIIEGRIERHPELGNCAFPRGSWLYEKWTNTIWSTCE
jgi:hypothetical protein